jgi:hypothetical protein
MLEVALNAIAANLKLEYDEYQTGVIMHQSTAQLYVVGKVFASGGSDPAPWFSERHFLTAQQHH